MSDQSILQLREVSAGYGDVLAIRDITLDVEIGSVVGVFGRNGAGKSTTMLAIAGVIPCPAGSIHFDGDDITKMSAHQRVGLGIGCVMEGRRIFRQRTVEENLLLGTISQKLRRSQRHTLIEEAYGRFAILKEKRKEAAGRLSGGQQQMLAIAQALMSKPKLLLFDEPSAGLSPAIVGDVLSIIDGLKADGLSIVLVEQLIDRALPHVDSFSLIDDGRIVYRGSPNDSESIRVARNVYLARASTSDDPPLATT
jgi:branched-chain amino acid transport system ATP-binding protein